MAPIATARLGLLVCVVLTLPAAAVEWTSFEGPIVDPALPEWLPEIAMRDLRVGEASVTLRFWRDPEGDSHFEVIRKRGTLRIVRQTPPESLSVGVLERLGGLVETGEEYVASA